MGGAGGSGVDKDGGLGLGGGFSDVGGGLLVTITCSYPSFKGNLIYSSIF